MGHLDERSLAQCAAGRAGGPESRHGGDLAALSDVVLEAPTKSTPRVQEFHILYYHHLCQQIEARICQT